MLIFMPICGVVMDLFGRKLPIIIPFFVIGIYLIAVPWFGSIYPWFAICKVTVSILCVFVSEAPLTPDYIDKDSIGLF